MNEKKTDIGDSLYDVMVKLCVIRDFMQTLEDEKNCISKHTPEGLSMIIGECVAVLKQAGESI